MIQLPNVRRLEPAGAAVRPEKLEMVQSRAEARQAQPVRAEQKPEQPEALAQVRAEQRQAQQVRLVQKLGRLEMLHRVRLEYPVRVERRQAQQVRLAQTRTRLEVLHRARQVRNLEQTR